MARDKNVYCLGEDILDPYGGAFKVTRGLSTKFPERVLTTPISEAAIVGTACGMAMRGLRPVVEIMFGDFLMLAMDQIVNHAAKFKWMYNDQVNVPIVIRTPMGGGRGYGPTHSQNLEKHLLGIPGLTVIAPNHLLDPGKILEQAVEDNDAVVFIEDKVSYSKELVTAVEGMQIKVITDTNCAYPTLLVSHPGGSDGVIFCYGPMALKSLEAVRILREQEGLRLGLAVFTRISPIPETHINEILASLSSGPCFYLDEASPAAGFGADVLAAVNRVNQRQAVPLELSHFIFGAEPVPTACCRKLEEESSLSVKKLAQKILNEY